MIVIKKLIVFLCLIKVGFCAVANTYETSPLFGKISISREEMGELRKKYGYFSQVGEDIILSIVFQPEIAMSQGKYIDVGAHHPRNINVCHYFYLHGWRGINIEPQPNFHALLQHERKEDVNLQCLIGKQKGEHILHEVLVEKAEWVSALSTASEKTSKILSEQRGYKTKSYMCLMQTMDDVVNEYLLIGTVVNFLKIDVEGFERDVLEGINFTNFRPLVILIEILSPAGAFGYKEWGDILLTNNYKLVLADNLNFYYVRQESPEIVERFKNVSNELSKLKQ